MAYLDVPDTKEWPLYFFVDDNWCYDPRKEKFLKVGSADNHSSVKQADVKLCTVGIAQHLMVSSQPNSLWHVISSASNQFNTVELDGTAKFTDFEDPTWTP